MTNQFLEFFILIFGEFLQFDPTVGCSNSRCCTNINPNWWPCRPAYFLYWLASWKIGFSILEQAFCSFHFSLIENILQSDWKRVKVSPEKKAVFWLKIPGLKKGTFYYLKYYSYDTKAYLLFRMKIWEMFTASILCKILKFMLLFVLCM